jgi:hypothetical protein
MMGPSVVQGPHQGAHRSTTTGTSEERLSTSSSNVASVTSIISTTIPGAPRGSALLRDPAAGRVAS